MNWHKDTLEISTSGRGMYPFTQAVDSLIREWGVQEGMCYLYIQHTSASLVISESYDPSAKIDLEAFMDRLAPEGEAWHRHTREGGDDSPSHMRAMLTNTSMTIPIRAITDSVVPVMTRATATPINENGIANMMTNGSSRDSNCDAITM